MKCYPNSKFSGFDYMMLICEIVRFYYYSSSGFFIQMSSWTTGAKKQGRVFASNLIPKDQKYRRLPLMTAIYFGKHFTIRWPMICKSMFKFNCQWKTKFSFFLNWKTYVHFQTFKNKAISFSRSNGQLLYSWSKSWFLFTLYDRL